jgi:hypothetical protein
MTVEQALRQKEAASVALNLAVRAEGKARQEWREQEVGSKEARAARSRLRAARRKTVKAENRLAAAKSRLQKARKDDRDPSGALWHPDATRVTHQDAGAFTGGGRKLVWHTTEGSSLPDYGGSSPHFTLNPRTGDLWQHIPLNRAARALAHPSGPETNRANAIQVELIGFAKDTQDWSSGAYANVAELARWIEGAFGVPRRTGVKFTVPATRLSGQGFVDYEGHIGHAHVPGNDHWDPGKFRIDLVI